MKTPDFTPVAIIGMGCLFPRSPGLKSYWRLLRTGTDAIEEVPPTHWQASDYFDPDPKRPDHVYCTRGGYLQAVAFDPTEFGIPPNVLQATDTSQLLGLVAARMALDDAGYYRNREFDRERTSVILGVTGTQELVIPLGARMGHPIWRRALDAEGLAPEMRDRIVSRIGDAYVPWQENSFPGLLGNVVAGRIANRLDLGGTNCVVDAACASSMSAVHMALMELATSRSDMVVTGGVDTLNDIFMHMCFSRTGILSPTGDVRPFAKSADGTVLGEGAGVVVLKRLDAARQDGDRIYAVIRGIGTSSDGRAQSIYAPNAKGQAKALRRAYESAGVPPTTVELVEAHGTGTRVGDRVEFDALRTVFNAGDADNGRPRRCALGSVKSMIGHTKAAAGAAGLIKAALALHHKVLPPTLKVEAVSPDLDFSAAPFYLSTTSRPWIGATNHPRRAAVSAFGFGGANFHLVMEEIDSRKPEVAWDHSMDILAFSADTAAELADNIAVVKASPAVDDPEPLAYRAAETRRTFSSSAPFRLVVLAGADDAIGPLLDAAETTARSSGEVPDALRNHLFWGSGNAPGRLAFLFPGQGSQYPQMGKDLLNVFPEALDAFQAMAAAFDRQPDLGAVVYPEPAADKKSQRTQEADLRQTDAAQPAIGALSLAMLRILERFGVQPQAATGHSFGELSALLAAGRLSQEDFCRLAVLRGRYMAAAGAPADGDPGSMLAVRAPLDKIEALIEAEGLDVLLANRNSPEQGVLSGATEAIESAAITFKKAGMRSLRLPVAAAFHSPLVKAAQEPFSQALAPVAISPSSVPVYANATAEPYPAEEADARALLGRQILSPVDFVSSVQRMAADGVRTFVEVGPKTVLTGLVKRILPDTPVRTLALDGSGGKGDAMVDLAMLLAALAADGHAVDLRAWEPATDQPPSRRMVVPITGANLRPDPSKTQNPAPSAAVPSDGEGNDSASSGPTSSQESPGTPSKPENRFSPDQGQAAARRQRPGSVPIDDRTMKNPFPPSASPPQDALAVVQEGITAIQKLHQETADAHRQFLDAQTEASRAMSRLMAYTRELTTGQVPADGIFDRLPAEGNTAPAAAGRTDDAAAGIRPTIAAEIAASPAPATAAVQAAAPPPAAAAAAETEADAAGIEETLLEVVGLLTGYPVETLTSDMDLEADLGIDSIKRVEILSALEERLPQLPPVSPEILSELRTLADIAQAIDSQSVAASPTQRNPSAAGRKTDSDALAARLFQIVAELTGYPVETLDADMDLEADLGIDSIKRVEILSALEEALPGLATFSPEDLGELKTLGQIAARIADAGGEQADAAEVPSPPPAPGTGRSAPDSADGVASQLFQIVAELTGYPVETLDADMDLEADLGIDSIKRVEILSALEEALPSLPPVSPDVLPALKTLGQIARHLSEGESASAATEPPPPAGPTADGEAIEAPPAPAASLDRRCVAVVDAGPLDKSVADRAWSGPIVVAGGADDPLCLSMVALLSQRDIPAPLLALDDPPALDRLPEVPGDAAGMIIVAPAPPDGDAAPSHTNDTRFLAAAFRLVRQVAPQLIQRSARQPALLATVTRLEGVFGFGGGPVARPVLGGLAGLVKTAAQEWTTVRCRALDLSPAAAAAAPDRMAADILSELLEGPDDGPIEVGLGAGTRRVLSSAALDAPVPGDASPLDAEGAFIVTGGGRGVTAETAVALAAQRRLKLALWGRSAPPEEEPAWLRGLSDAAQIKRAILENAFGGQATPRKIEAAYRRWSANRELTRTLDRLQHLGADVTYQSVDVRDPAAVTAAVDKARRRFGAVAGIFHGAGALADRLIVDKSDDQFQQVFDTKVLGLLHLLEATAQDPLQCIVLYSSVAARYGNPGQSDYAMANEALNKLAHTLQGRRSRCRVLSVNWGPWDGGMVTPALRREFQRRGIDLIAPEAGAAALAAELTAAQNPPTVEIELGAPLTPAQTAVAPSADSTADPAAQPDPYSETARRDLDLNRFPVLKSHILNGVPVVPMALITEWLGHGALHDHPGMTLSAIEDLRVLTGIQLDTTPKRIRLLAGRSNRNGGGLVVPVEIRNGKKANGQDMIHSRAKAILTDVRPQAPDIAKPDPAALIPYEKPLDEVYERILFHGEALRGISRIIGISDKQMMAEVAAAPSPRQWMAEPLRSDWITDPLVLDCAFQMASLWCCEQTGVPSLPSYGAAYHQYRDRFPQSGVTAVMTVTEVNQHKMLGNFDFYDREDKLIARMTGFEAVMDPALIQAFRKNRLN